MTKKVLVLSASFRKHGNSDMLCDRFIPVSYTHLTLPTTERV